MMLINRPKPKPRVVNRLTSGLLKTRKKYLKARDSVPDYGCATGTVALETADKVKVVHGIGISSNMMDAAKRKGSEQNIEKLDFAQSTLSDERLKRESFEVILVFTILHFLEDIPEAMQRINELLKPGGLFISASPSSGEKKSFLSNLLFPVSKIGIIPPIRFFTIPELESSVTRRNFQIAETQSLNYNPTEYFIVAKKRG